MKNAHRLFVHLVNLNKINLVKQDMRWAHTMDIAIATGVLAMRFGLDENITTCLHAKFHQLLPQSPASECLSSIELNYYCQHSPEIEMTWNARDICDFILALAHRNYAFQYEKDRWAGSKFKAIPVGLPRTRNRTPKARNYTSHKNRIYQGYRNQLFMGTMYENPVIYEMQNKEWVAPEYKGKRIELTETRHDLWLHTRLNELPKVWDHINNLLNTIAQLDDLLSTDEKLEVILGYVAQIHWWISQGMPYRRGSAAIGDMLSKVVLQYHQVSTPCWKIGIAPDLEALCNPLEHYIKNYGSFFVKRPAFNTT